MTSISCSICLDDITVHTQQSILSCGHVYHKNCVRNWLQQHSACPECRSDTIDDSIRPIYLNFGEQSIFEQDRRKQKRIESLEKTVAEQTSKLKSEAETNKKYKLMYGEVDAELSACKKEVENRDKLVSELQRQVCSVLCLV